MKLDKTLTLTDLTLFGVASIMGSGGCNLIGTAVQTGGKWWPVACGLAATLLLGASHTYSRAIHHTKTGNTVESDIVATVFGHWAESFTIVGILVFNIVSISLILVVCSHILFPHGAWATQITIALLFLAGITLFSLQGIDTNRTMIDWIAIFLIVVLAITALLGYIGPLFHHTHEPAQRPVSFHRNRFRVSFFMFFFILAGFDALIKFSEEAIDSADIARSFFVSNIASSMLTVGIALAIIYWLPHISPSNEEQAFENIVGHFLGGAAKEGSKYVIVAFLITTSFVVFLAMTRYIYGLGKKQSISWLSSVNAQKAPYNAIGCISALAAVSVLNNHTDTLVMISDLGVMTSILLVSAAATVADWNAGESIAAVLSGLTTAGFGGILSLYIVD